MDNKELREEFEKETGIEFCNEHLSYYQWLEKKHLESLKTNKGVSECSNELQIKLIDFKEKFESEQYLNYEEGCELFEAIDKLQQTKADHFTNYTAHTTPEHFPIDKVKITRNISLDVHEALGEASMCWTRRPRSTFQTDRVVEIGKRLILAINEYAESLSEFRQTKAEK